MTAESKEAETTTEAGDEATNSTETNSAEMPEAESTPFEIPAEILNLFEFLSFNDKIVFKSQQIDDPELQRTEKVQIAREIFEKNRQTFLMRFGSYFEEQHLSCFAHLAISDGAAPLKPDENPDEIQLMLMDYLRKLHTRKLDVKNRRYAAMQQLIKKGEYFSEQEMMKRAPELYQELVGQYLSAAERKQRDSYDVKNTTISGIMLHTLEQQQIEKVLQQADEHNDVEERTVSSTSVKSKRGLEMATVVDDEEVVPESSRQQWGNFNDEHVSCIKYTKYITAGERLLLRQEFEGIMHEQFLAGNDKDFDYAQVDDNSQLDDLRQLNQDKEDAYFEASDDDAEDNVDFEQDEGFETESSDHVLKDREVQGMEGDDGSEDELDVYMSHLSKHHSLQIQN